MRNYFSKNISISFFQKLFFLIILITYISGAKYPIFENFTNETGSIRTIEIERRLQYLNYTKNNNTAVIFFANWCRYCFIMYEIFEYSSTYNLMEKWEFLKVNCTSRSSLCKFYNITRYPEVKIYTENKEMFYSPPQELIPFMEFLLKLDSSPIVNVTNFTDFFSKYGTFSPIVEINSNNDNSKDFYNCIKFLAYSEYRTIYYFGIKNYTDINNNSNNNHKKDKIIFDYGGFPDEFEWDGNCSRVERFLYANKYGLMSKINSSFIVEMGKNKKTLVMLFGYLSNNKTKDFIFNEFTQIAYKNRSIVFSYADYPNTIEINHYFNVKLYTNSEVRLVIFNFNTSLYYVYPVVYDMDINNKTEIKKDFEKLFSDLSVIYFTTGYGIKDFLKLMGMEEFSSKTTFIMLSVILIVMICITLSLLSCCDKFCPTMIEATEDEEKKVKEDEEKNKQKEKNQNSQKNENNANSNSNDNDNNNDNIKSPYENILNSYSNKVKTD